MGDNRLDASDAQVAAWADGLRGSLTLTRHMVQLRKENPAVASRDVGFRPHRERRPPAPPPPPPRQHGRGGRGGRQQQRSARAAPPPYQQQPAVYRPPPSTLGRRTQAAVVAAERNRALLRLQRDRRMRLESEVLVLAPGYYEAEVW